MKFRVLFVTLMVVLLSVVSLAAPAAAQEPAGIDAVSWRYAFASSSGTYTEITGGTVHGTASNDDESFNAIDLGFTFNYDGVDYTQISIQNNGFIAMGASVTSSYTPLSTGATNNVVAAVGRDIEGNDTTSELMSLSSGTAPNRVFTVQWKHYRRYGSTYTGDDWNWQIKLYETSNVVEVVYGSFAFHDATVLTPQVGLRGASNADFNNRMTDATHDWANSLAGTANTSTMSLSSALYPASGLTYDWTVATGLILAPATQSGSVCKGGDIVYNFEVANLTGVDQSFNLGYASVWSASGPSVTPVLANNTSWVFQVSVHIPWSATQGDTDVLTVTASDAGGTNTDTAIATTTAGLLAGWTDVNTAAPRPVRAPSVVYKDGKLYKIGGYDGAARAYLDIYDIATDTWTAGADMPDVRYWINCEAIGDGIYCAGGYSTAGQTTLYRYDIPSNSWTTLAAMSAYRYDYASAVLNGKYYVIGGYGAGYTATLWEYDPATNTWNYGLPSMTTGRRYAAAGVIGGKIYVAGGYSGSYLSSVEIYDPAVPGWSAGPSMPTTWLTAADGVKHDRYLIVAGGAASSTATSTNQGWMLDTVTGTWSAMPPMDHALYSAEGDGDGTNFYVMAGRLYEGGVYSYSPYTSLLVQCDVTCTPVSNLDFTWTPDPAITGDPVTFHATVDGSLAIAFSWDFGDGETGTGRNPVHAYAAPGDYLVQVTAVNCDGTGTAAWSETVTVYDAPAISVTPSTLFADHCGMDVTWHVFQVCNSGDLPLVWAVTDYMQAAQVAIPAPTEPLAATPASPVERPVITSPDQCAQYANYTGAEPIGAAEFCGAPAAAAMPAGGTLAPTDYGFAQDVGYISDNFVTFPLNNFTGQTVIGTNTAAYYGLDFDPSGTTLYALNDTTDQLGTIDLATGAFTALVSCLPPVDNWTGLAIDPVTGVFYASDATNLYIIDPATGAYTLVGPFGTTTMIAIAVNAEGQMYGHDITSDSIYSIDKTTGTATLIGLTGYAANYAQGMDFDNDDGTLYIFLYQGSGANVYGTVNLATGAVTPLAVSAPQGEFEGATQTTAMEDAPWLTEVPTHGVLPPDTCEFVTVTVDSTGMPAGAYYGGLVFESNDPVNPEVTIPVTLSVGCPDIAVAPTSLSAELCQGMTETQSIDICNNGGGLLTWEFEEEIGTRRGVQSLTGSNVTFDPLAGGAACYIPGTAQTFCFEAESFSPDWEYVYNVWLKFPSNWTVSNAYVVGTPVCAHGNFGTFAWGFETSPYEINISHPRYQYNYPDETCVATYCVDVVSGAAAADAPASWYWDGDGYAGTPHQPCSDDQYTPASMSGYPCDEWINPRAMIPPCEGVGWLSETPEGGSLEPGECETVDITFDADALPAGDYLVDLLINSNDPDTPVVTIPVTMTVLEPVSGADFSWSPLNPAFGVDVTFQATVVGGSEPLTYDWTFGDGGTGVGPVVTHAYAAAGDYVVTLTVSNDCGEDVVEKTITVNADPDIAVDPASLSSLQQPDEVVVKTFDIGNVGASDLVWTIVEEGGTLIKMGAPAPNAPQANADVAPVSRAPSAPLALGDLLFEVDVQGPTGDNQILGGEFALGYYWFTGGGASADPNKLYKFNPDGSLAATYDQPAACTGWGGRDLAFDGTYLYFGCDSGYIYQIDPATGAATGVTIPDPITPARALTYDPATDSFWTANWDSTLYNFDRTGATIGTCPAVGLSTYGMAWDTWSTGGPFLWLWSQDGPDPLLTASQLNPATCALTGVSFLGVGVVGEMAGGAAISDQIVPGQVVFLGMNQGVSDRAGIYDLGVAMGCTPSDIPWATVDPISGTTVPGGSVPVDVTFDSTGLADGTYTADLCIESNDPDEPYVIVPLTLIVQALADIEVSVTALDVGLCPDSTTTVTFTICNEGLAALDWEMTELSETLKVAVQPPAVRPAGQRVELTLEAAGGASVETNPVAPDAPVVLVLDDGSRDNDIGLGGTIEMLWVNRFTPAAGEFPFALNQIQIYFSSVGLVNVGDDIVLLVYENTTGGNDPAVGANLLAEIPTTVQALDTWNVYDLATPVVLNGPGDVVIGAIGMETPGTDYWPASIDQTATQARSWAGWWNASPPPTPPVLPPDNWTLIDAYFPGNWMVRGYGETIAGYDVPWMSEAPISGTVPSGECQVVAVTFDATGLTPGEYLAGLFIESNDPFEPEVTIPVTMTVLEAIAGADFTWTPPAPLNGEPVTFVGSITAGDLPVFTWNFGDGTPLQVGQTVVHTFALPGDYLVTLTVSNDCGEDVVEYTVTVEQSARYYYLPIITKVYAAP